VIHPRFALVAGAAALAACSQSSFKGEGARQVRPDQPGQQLVENPDPPPEQLGRLREAFDKNGDGKLDETFDKNGDGHVDEGIERGPDGRIKEEFDKNGDGKVDGDFDTNKDGRIGDDDALADEDEDAETGDEDKKKDKSGELETEDEVVAGLKPGGVGITFDGKASICLDWKRGEITVTNRYEKYFAFSGSYEVLKDDGEIETIQLQGEGTTKLPGKWGKRICGARASLDGFTALKNGNRENDPIITTEDHDHETCFEVDDAEGDRGGQVIMKGVNFHIKKC
jgi:hypothetical protein